ncbi:MAG: 3'-5' exonuclease domain-containing protein 2 [Bacteroidales bacterium]|nr:3'-5' exonuclease domain-containing protein 2 [Candidatus Cryptobacteroides caccocaballi]
MFKESITPDELSKLQMASFPGTIHVITGDGPAFDRAIRYLRKQEMIGFDTETRPCFSPHQPHYGVALLQLSGPDHAFLFRINKMELNRRLRNILSSTKILKIGAAVHDDIRGLQKKHDFVAGGFVDLQKIGCEWGIRDKSVKKMAGIILDIRISKTQQLSNWEAEALTDAQAMYAATDAWVCLEMYRKLLDTEKNPLPPDPVPEKAEVNTEKSENSSESKPKPKRRRRKPAASAAAVTGEAAPQKRRRPSRNHSRKRKAGSESTPENQPQTTVE